MMSKEKRRVPKLRFPGFTEDWEQRKLGEYANFRRGSFPQPYGNKEWYDGVDSAPFVQVVDVGDNLSLVDCTKQRISKLAQPMSVYAEKGSVLVTLQGSIGRVAVSQYDAFIDRTILIFQGYKYKTNPYFWAYIIKGKFSEEALKAPGGTIKTITKEALSNFIILYPKFSEQEQIGSFFEKLDKLITLHQRKLDNLKLKKKALLQKLFPKNGDRYPELRFPGFTDAWEQRKLSDVLIERNEQQVETREYPLMSFVQGLGVTPKGERYDRSFLVLDQSKKYKRTELGDFIYSSNNLETGSIGINKTGKAVISPVYSIFQGVSIGDSQFIGIMSLLPRFIAKMIRFRQGVVYGQWRIHETDFLDISVLIPSVDERTKITQLILSIEELITLHQRKLDHLQLQKKALLQQMFV